MSHFAFLLGEQPAQPAAWPADRVHRHVSPDWDFEAPIQGGKSGDSRRNANQTPQRREELRVIRAANVAKARAVRSQKSQASRASLSQAAGTMAAAAIAGMNEPKAMTYAEAIAIRERSRMRQPVDQAKLLEANRLVDETRAARRQDAYGA